MFEKWLHEIRANLGAPPRTLAADPYLTPPYADWLHTSPHDPLFEQYCQHAFLFANGEVSWAATVQCNNLMFEPGTHNAHAALAVFSPIPHFDDAPEELGEISDAIYELREQKQRDPILRKFRDQLEDEMGRYGRRFVPRTLSNGQDVLLVDVMIHREHLPGGFLAGGIYPVLHHPNVWPIWIVPARFWPEGFIEEWPST